MKKISIMIIIALTSASAFCQSVSLGPKVGLNISNYTGGDLESNALIGVHLGGILNLGLGKSFSLQPEVLFSTQGAKIVTNSQKKDFKTTYVAVPVMAKFKSAAGLYFEIGPQVSFRTSEDIPDKTIDQFSKNLDLAVGVGVGYHRFATSFALLGRRATKSAFH